MFNPLYLLLAKISKKKRDGPSREIFLKNNDLKKIDNNSKNSFLLQHNFDNEKDFLKSFFTIDKFVCNNFNIADKCEINNNNIKYLHYVIEIGKYKFHDDLEILIFKNYLKIRSSSRVGKYDFNVNENRINFIIKNFFN